MANSSGSNRSGSGNCGRRPVRCDCEHPKPPMERVSWSDSNPGWRFLNCVDSLVNKIKTELRTFKDKSYCGKLLKKVAELEKMHSDLEVELVAEREANEGGRVQASEERARLVKELEFLKKKLHVAIGLLGIAVGVMLVWYF
ncbi:hypothetical protein LXL04_008677 [Taraxacum kok-saghyz]